MYPKFLAPGSWGRSLGLLTALCVSLVLNLGAFLIALNIMVRDRPEYTSVSSDQPREVPIKVRTIQAAFHDDPSHYGVEGTLASAEWDAIAPTGGGMLLLGGDVEFGVSMWHQMQCLDHIRTVLVSGDDGSDHTSHCLDYLRQGILCNADTTLELATSTMKLANGNRVAAGEGTVHTCRDWRQVYDWMESQHEN